MLYFKIALRFLKSSLGQTILIIVGIAVGVSVQIFIGSLISGLQDDLVNTTIGNSSQVTISSKDSSIEDYSDIITYLDSESNITKVTPIIKSSGNIIYGEKTSPVVFLGLENDKENIYSIKDKLTSGSMPANDSEIVIGMSLFETLGLSLGENISLSIPLKGEHALKVVGTFDLGVSGLNSTYTVLNLSAVQSILGTPSSVSSIEMQVKDVFSAKDTASKLLEHYGETYSITNWEDENGDLLSGLTAQSSSSLLIQVFVSISVVLAIASVLAISVEKKQRQIGILKAMGMTDHGTSLIFLFEGLILGAFGAITGVLLGLFLNYSFQTFALDTAGNPVVPINFEPKLITILALIALLSSALASLIPARKSTKLSVIEVIKNG